ncbi:MAG TPA: MBL fold metallo-hydrolase, partial [Acholeplasma sp.]|nr:MBL fold metallo-hydrolase [Acholeplasma sp.]
RSKINSEHKLLSQIKLAFLVNLIILPFSNKLNIISILINPFLIIIIVNIIFPITIINAILNINILTKVITFFEDIIIEVGKLDFNILLPSLNPYLITIYFILLISSLVFKTRKQLVSIILLLTVLIVPIFKKYYYDPKLYFLDVGQGDSSVYISKDNVLVFDAYKNVSNLLKYEGIYVIDYLVLSHSHLDHTNEADELLKTFKVRNVIISAYDNYNIIFNTNIIEGRAGLVIKDKDIKIEILSPSKDYYNSNNNSLVFIFSYNDTNILYTGDIEFEAESDLLYFFFKEQKRNIDILKVAHHGSNTSSYLELIKEINSKIAIISVGINNNYNMPNENVINNLISLGTKVYRTDLDGTILYYDNEIILL